VADRGLAVEVIPRVVLHILSEIVGKLVGVGSHVHRPSPPARLENEAAAVEVARSGQQGFQYKE